MPSLKILIGKPLAFYAANESSLDSLEAAIRKHVDCGWIVKGPSMKVRKDLWTQRMVLPKMRVD
jgi:endonuclease V-like protein UPF0215 family